MIFFNIPSIFGPSTELLGQSQLYICVKIRHGKIYGRTKFAISFANLHILSNKWENTETKQSRQSLTHGTVLNLRFKIPENCFYMRLFWQDRTYLEWKSFQLNTGFSIFLTFKRDHSDKCQWKMNVFVSSIHTAHSKCI